jgi:hypothetical protein
MCGHVLAKQYDQRIQKWEEKIIKQSFYIACCCIQIIILKILLN